MWLQRGGHRVLVPEHMLDTIKRCLSEGWEQLTESGLEAPPSAPVPPEVAARVEAERIAAIHANNDAARAAFGQKPKNRR